MMYQISKIITKVQVNNGKGVKHLLTKGRDLENEFVLNNKNVYSEKGELVKEALNPDDYDAYFSAKIKNFKPVYRIKELLNFHYSNSPDKETFRNHLQYVILSFFDKFKHSNQIKLIEDWLRENQLGIISSPEEWLRMTPQQKEQEAYAAYKMKHNDNNRRRFYQIEIEFLNTILDSYEKKGKLNQFELEYKIIAKEDIIYYQNKINDLDQKENHLKEYKTSYNSFIFNQVKEKYNSDNSLNESYYFNVLKDSTKLDSKNAKFKDEPIFLELVKLICQDICKLYKTVERFRPETNEENVKFNRGISNDFRMIEAELNRQLNEIQNAIERAGNGSLNEEIIRKKRYGSIILQFTHLLKSSFGIDVLQSPLKMRFKVIIESCSYKDLIPLLGNTNSQEVTKDTSKQINDSPPSKTKAAIDEQFEKLDGKGWAYAFKKEADYEIFSNLLVKYFENEKYELPNKTIGLNKRCKTRLAATLHSIHSECAFCEILKKDTGFFQIIRILEPFHSTPQTSLYHLISKAKNE